MKANEYIKKYGLVCANIRVAEIEHTKDFDGFYLDLKRLVESHQIVKTTFKGLEDAKWWHECCWDCDSVAHIPIDRLKQAIADVESCMEVNHG